MREVFRDLPSPDVVRDVIIGAVARLRPALDAHETRPAELTQALSELERQIGNLVDAIANGDLPAVGVAAATGSSGPIRAK